MKKLQDLYAMSSSKAGKLSVATYRFIDTTVKCLSAPLTATIRHVGCLLTNLDV